MDDLLNIEYTWDEPKDDNRNLPVFNADDYIHSAMHCPSLEKARIFLRYLDEHGYKWCTEHRYTEFDHWEFYGKDTCYHFADGTFCDVKYHIDIGCLILEFDDFDWSDWDE